MVLRRVTPHAIAYLLWTILTILYNEARIMVVRPSQRTLTFVLLSSFDSLSKPALWLFLTRIGVSDKIVRLMIRALYDHSVSCVRAGGAMVQNWIRRAPGMCVGTGFICYQYGCWKGRFDKARMVCRLAGTLTLIWTSQTLSLSWLNCLNSSYLCGGRWQVRQLR